MSQLTREEIAKVALLSRLHFTDAELDSYAGELSKILDHVEQLKAVDVEGVEPTSHSLRLVNVLRPDLVQASLTNAEAMANAPSHADGMFKLPAILKGASGS